MTYGTVNSIFVEIQPDSKNIKNDPRISLYIMFLRFKGALNCTLCEPGFEQPLKNRTNCTACMPGSFSEYVKLTNLKISLKQRLR